MPRPSNTAERREQIARGLLSVMAKTGYERAAIVDVARAAKLASGLVHYHFENKLAILEAAVEVLRADYEARLGRLLAVCAGDPKAELRAFVDAHLHTGAAADAETLACWIDISGESLRQPRIQRAFARIILGSRNRLRDIVERGVTAGSFECKKPDVAAAAIMAAIQGYFVLGATAREAIPRGSAADATMAMAAGLLAVRQTAQRTKRKQQRR